MMYDNAVDQIKGLKAAKDAVELPFHLAKVTSLSNGRAYVQFYGDSSPSSKLYPYIEGYKPTVNDDVLMLRQGSTYIIAGKISKDNITGNYYLMKSVADSTYLTQAQADERYAPIDIPKPRVITPQEGIYFGFPSSSTTSYVIGYSSNQGAHLDLGRNDPNARFGYGYFDGLGGDSSQKAIQALNVKDSNVYGNILPASNNSSNIGSSSSKQFNNVYAKQFYQNGTAISTSDKRKKKTIKDITKKYIDFFRKLRPRTFVFRNGESGRTHCGFIAQEVEEAAHEAGIENKDLAFLCIDNEGNYGLRYEELIALQTQIIQDLLVRVEKLEEGSKK